ncbi:helix-turn-helix domain-containing protein [Algoriphagus pacificus]|uniref:Helix-turn-helix domain-containing protein n=1 Tax=Algoriphagus pacificus TaxID=2811234 RepID=A0ABS3CMB4_9BACT|nr:helix-turn-helix transcriptional regulator [Algoriphagus pacificus]MBN7817679.1 helix-turn-helix domain-containing protein [Algoriphagus pacificus]
MTENQRLKIVRKFLNRTQVDFASSIGLTQAGYSDIERGKNNVSGKIKILLKREHDVNISWLETGDGEMFLPMSEKQKTEEQAEIYKLKLEIERLEKENNRLISENNQLRKTSDPRN